MWRLLTLSVLLLWGASEAQEAAHHPAHEDKPTHHDAGDDDDGDHFGGGRGIRGLFGDILDPRLASNAIRIMNLERKVDYLKGKLGDAAKVDPQEFAKEMDARVTDLEGTHCPRRRFQCGGNERECVSDLLVCDGHKDCHNGHDEEDDVCSTAPVKSGNVFSGTSHWTDCYVREDHVTRITITSSARSKFFSARMVVTATVASDLEDKDGHFNTYSYDAKGYYVFARRRLVLLPAGHEDYDHVGVICDFNTGDNERAECHRVLESTLHECADLHVTLE